MKKALTLTNIKQLHDNGDLDAAKTAYLTFLRIQPKNSEALHHLGILCAQQNHIDEAIHYLKMALKYQPQDITIRLHLANLFKHQRLFDQAIDELKQILALSPDYAPALNNLGTIYFAQNQLTLATEAYSRAIALQPQYIDAYYNLGLALNKQNEISRAIEHFKKLLTLAPDHIPSKFHLASLLMRQEEIDHAISVFLDIEKYHPHHFETQTNLATCYLKKGLLQQAQIHYQKALELNTDDPQILFNLGVINTQQGRIDYAIQYYQRAAQLDPHHFDTHNNLGFAFLTKRHIPFALQHYREALRIQPNNIAISHTINILTQQKNLLTSPPDYIKALFDSYAGHYEAHLLQTLQYTVPELLFQAFINQVQPSAQSLQILDLGCGTGLCAAHFKPYAKKLAGIDLSANMLAIAAQKNIFDEIITSDVESFLRTQFGEYDLILAGDALVYSGDLTEIFQCVRLALNKNGFFLFNTEITKEADFKMNQSGRFSHHKEYLETLAKKNHFTVLYYQTAITRLQDNAPVYGHVFLLSL